MGAMLYPLRSLITLPALVLLVLLSPARSDATTSSYADAAVQVEEQDPQYIGSITGTHSVAITRGGILSDPPNPGSTSATARGSARAIHGALEASTYLSIAGDLGGNGSSRGIATFLDDVTIHPSDPGLVGLPGTFTIPIVVAGGILGSPPSGGVGFLGFLFAEWSYAVQVNQVEEWSAGDDVTISLFINDPEEAVLTTGLFESAAISFVFGEPFELGAELIVRGGGTVAATLSGFESLVLGANWQGITEVRDEGGNLVAFTMESESGTDYAAEIAVPEASSPIPALATCCCSRRCASGRFRVPR
jgi:hypothetical protein